ncbi:Hypothetical predicted protein [Lecanosticta acicola]|uniref:Uncharacterized protein n=1 Tax=Lecanosticta acicola TaxID=111012 RepID=A0AAI8Z6D2_9PEZI|nr:Hypothetical predicted protein [Lecanosticta acicola]
MSEEMSRIKVVRVACDGEGLEPKAYDLPSTHEIFSKGAVSNLTTSIGITLLILNVYPSLKVPNNTRTARQQRPPKTYGYTPDGPYFPNSIASILLAADDLRGSVMVARQDGRDLYVEHLDMIMQFFHSVVEAKKEYHGTDEEVAAMMSPLVFRRFYEQQVKAHQDNAVKCHSLADVPSPFSDINTEIILAGKSESMDVDMAESKDEGVAW